MAATRSRCQPRAPHGVASLCQAGADRLTFRNVRFIRGHSWRTYQKQASKQATRQKSANLELLLLQLLLVLALLLLVAPVR